MPRTYEPIATANGTGSSNAIEFTSIPSTYTDLVMVVNARQTGSLTYSFSLITVNNDTSGTSYSRTILRGNGTTVSSSRDTNYAQLYAFDYIPGANAAADELSAGIVHIMNYSNTTTFKTFLIRDNAAGGGTAATIGLWRSTAAINKIVFSAFSGNWTTTTSVTLYGIRAA